MCMCVYIYIYVYTYCFSCFFLLVLSFFYTVLVVLVVFHSIRPQVLGAGRPLPIVGNPGRHPAKHTVHYSI